MSGSMEIMKLQENSLISTARRISEIFQDTMSVKDLESLTSHFAWPSINSQSHIWIASGIQGSFTYL